MDRAIRIGPVRITAHFALMLVFFVYYITKMIRAFSKTTEAGGIWNYIQIFFVVLGVIYILFNLKKFANNRSFMFLFFFCIAELIIGAFGISFSTASVFNYLVILYPVAIFAIACHEAARVDIEDGIVLLGAFYVMSAFFIVNMWAEGTFSTKTGATADVYYILGLLPIALVQEKINQFIPIVACGFAVLLSGKRTGILLFITMIIVYYVFQVFTGQSVVSQIKSFLFLIVIVVLFVYAFDFLNTGFNTNLLNRLNRIWEDNDSSGRYLRWTVVTRMLQNSSTVSLLFGHGHYGLIKAIGFHAHNDFLEVLFDFGIFTLAGYIGFYVSLIFDFIKMIINKYEYSLNFLISIICALGLSMYSFYVIDPTYITSGMLCFGYFMTDFQKKHSPESSLAQIGKRNEANE